MRNWNVEIWGRNGAWLSGRAFAWHVRGAEFHPYPPVGKKIWGKGFPGRGHSMCKGPEVGADLACWRPRKEAGGVEQAEMGRWGGLREGVGSHRRFGQK